MIFLGRFKIVNIKRFKIFIIISAFLISLIIFTLMNTVTVYPKEEIQYEYIYVRAGDTLWQIASEYNNNMDIRKFIKVIMDENSLNSAIIYPGDVLKVPLNY